MISVCMCTYNGEKYIEEQLESLRNQTLQPDEVIICDDRSGDKTAVLVEEYIHKYHLENTWRLLVNTENRGYPDNFYFGMGLCRGDVIFLADQDDIWHPEKVERTYGVLMEHPGAKVACCKFGLIDGAGEKLHTVMKPTYSGESRRVERISLEQVFYRSEWNGMVLAYRREWYEKRNAKEKYAIPHDMLLAAEAAEEQGFLRLDEELAYHRRHDNNAGGEEHRLGTLLNKRRKLWEIGEYIRFLRAYEEEEVLQTPEGRAVLGQKRCAMQERYDALKSGRILRVVQNAWKNRGMVRPATLVCDVLIARQPGDGDGN